MASYQYRVIVTEPGKRERIVTCPSGEWTSALASTYAHVDGYSMPAGTRIQVDRRRSPVALYQTHRWYEVEAGGAVRMNR